MLSRFNLRGPVVSSVRAGTPPAANAGVVSLRLPQGNDSNEVEISTETDKGGANYTRAVVVSAATLKFWLMNWAQTFRIYP